MTCKECGCTDERACVDEATGERCSWPWDVDPFDPVCSFCEDEDRRMGETIG